ncbi:MAG: hypothetical protein CMJ28_04735 [Phycisphaerae bacterium]|nr:hypothetical protein [Phycisphaerae bacterium]
MILTFLILAQSYSNDPIQHDRPSDRLAGWLSPEAVREVDPFLQSEYQRRNRLPRPLNTAGFMMFGLAPAQGRTPWLLEQTATSTQRLQTVIGVRNRNQNQWSLLMSPFGTTGELPSTLNLSGFNFSTSTQRSLRQDAKNEVLGGALNSVFDPSLAWNQERQKELLTTSDVARFGGKVWRTIIGDGATATGLDAKSTAEAVSTPVGDDEATQDFESRIGAINAVAQAPVEVSRLALDLDQDRSQCNRWLIALDDQLENDRWIDAGQTADKILRLTPSHPEAMLGEVLANLGAGLWLSASVAFDRLLDTNPILVAVRPDQKLRPSTTRLQEAVDLLKKLEQPNGLRLAIWVLELLGQDEERDVLRQSLDAEQSINQMLDAGLGLHSPGP